MAAYDYRCRTCGTTFEVRKPIGETATDVRCPDDHVDVARIWSPIAVARASSGSPMSRPASAPVATGGCCGGGCCG
jgi:putative FmdB family regulatory protein